MENKGQHLNVLLKKILIPYDQKESNPIPIYVAKNEDDLPGSISSAIRKYARALGFFSSKIDVVLISSEQGAVSLVLLRPGSSRVRFVLGERLAKLPDGVYEIKTKLSDQKAFEAILGYCLSAYNFQKYKKQMRDFNVKVALPKNVNYELILAFANSEYLTRNLINTPANDMGPGQLEEAIKSFSKQNGAQFRTFVGDELLQNNFPLIHCVGAGASEPPRLTIFTSGNPKDVKVTLVGKGVCFDTGGLNIKSDSAMSIMKKDMGGAASVLGLAQCIISLRLKVYLTVIIPIVENSISSGSFRPSDILRSRKGVSIEVNNTDAEGRLILADSLAFADETSPDILICMATLTGAARVALGPDIVPFYTNNDDFSNLLYKGSINNFDPVWRLPLHSEYEYLIEPELADLDNSPNTAMAGSITAALFVKRFVENAKIFVHFDLYSWSAAARPARQVGGVMQAVRAIYYALEQKVERKNTA